MHQKLNVEVHNTLYNSHPPFYLKLNVPFLRFIAFVKSAVLCIGNHSTMNDNSLAQVQTMITHWLSNPSIGTILTTKTTLAIFLKNSSKCVFLPFFVAQRNLSDPVVFGLKKKPRKRDLVVSYPNNSDLSNILIFM